MNNIKNRNLWLIFLSVSIVLGAASYIALWRYDAFVTEAALSMSAKVLQSELDTREKCERVRDNLVFVRLSEADKQKLYTAILRGEPSVTNVAQTMEEFSYGITGLKEIAMAIAQLPQEAVMTFRVSVPETADENAKELIQKLYRENVRFKTVDGDGSDLLRRYYCANVCIDACADGSLRYLADIREASGEDPLLAILCRDNEKKVLEESVHGEFVFQKVQTVDMLAELCISAKNGRVIAAKIVFTS